MKTRLGAVISSPQDIVLGAATVVCLDEEVFGKPSSDDDAARMLRRLSGRDHWVYAGICILSGAHRILDLSSTKVSFVELTEDDTQVSRRNGKGTAKLQSLSVLSRLPFVLTL